jgi:hypothetical protein
MHCLTNRLSNRKEMKKIQEFNNAVGTFKVRSTYHPEENVWTSSFCEPFEWNSEREMRLDMLIHYSDIDSHQVSFWDLYDEDDFLEKYSAWMTFCNQDYED